MRRVVPAPHSILRAHVTGESEDGNRMIIYIYKMCLGILLNFDFDFCLK